ncbi:MAG: DUF3467 domain-containing protein [Planctomycetales bacterium]
MPEEPIQPSANTSVTDPVVPQPAAPAQGELTVDDSSVSPLYANFCRVSSTPEELIIDVGLNTSPMSTGDVKVKISERIIINHYTAKRLLAALTSSLERHEQLFGVVETNVRRRINVNR